MRLFLLTMLVWIATAAAATADPLTTVAPVNPAIDMEGHLRVSAEAARHRESRRITEAEFIRMAREPGTVVLDARSAAMYAGRHVKGAVNVSYPDFAASTLAQAIPDPSTRILIYCNNNFANAGDVFLLKAITESLNLVTYIALYDYGYKNVYELGPRVDIHDSTLEFEPPVTRDE